MKLSKEKEQELKSDFALMFGEAPEDTAKCKKRNEITDFWIKKINTELERRDEQYIAIEVGCLECSNDHEFYGVFKTIEEANASFKGKPIEKIRAMFGESQRIVIELNNK